MTTDKPVQGEPTAIVQADRAVISATDNPALAMVEAVQRAAANPDISAEKMERLWAIAKDAQAMQAQQQFAQAMALAQAEMPRIVKNNLNKQTSSKFAKLEQIIDKITPIYTKHGFSLSFGTADSPLEKHIRIVCTVRHAGGAEKVEHYDQPIDDAGIRGEVNKTPTHGRGSALTYGRRYLTTLVFNLSIGEDDDGNAAGGGKGVITETDTVFITRAEACTEPQEAADLRREVIQAYGSSSKVPPAVMAAVNAARDSTRPRD